MRKLTLSLAVAASALVAGSVAYAQPADWRGGEPMTRSAVEQRAGAAFARLDANGDGKLDSADRAARQKARFDRLDADSDGGISYAEFTAAHETRHGRHAGNGEATHRGRDGHRMGQRGMMRGMARMADADEDGAVTQAEFQSAALARFDRVDANRDGTISAEERQAHRGQMRERFRERREMRNQG